MVPYLLATLALANLVTVSASFGALDLFSVLLPVIAARSCGCFYLGLGLLLSLAVACIHYWNGGVFSGADVGLASFGPQQLWAAFFLNIAGTVIGATGIPLFLSESLVSTSLACQLLLFDFELKMSMRRQFVLLLTPLVTVGLTALIHHMLSLYLEPKMESLADIMLALRPVVPSLFILGTLFFLAMWFPSAFDNAPLLLFAMVILFMLTLMTTKYLIGPRIKQMVYTKFPQCMSAYMEEGNMSMSASSGATSEPKSPTKSGIECTRIVEVLSISQAGFALVTLPGYAAMVVCFLHQLCSRAQLDTSWAVPVGISVTGAAVVLSVHRLSKMINEKVSIDAIQGLSCQIATLSVCLAATLAGLEVNFAVISLASVFSSDYFKRRKSTRNILILAVHSIVPGLLSFLIKSIIFWCL